MAPDHTVGESADIGNGWTRAGSQLIAPTIFRQKWGSARLLITHAISRRWNRWYGRQHREDTIIKYKYKLINRCNWFECCWASNPDRDACPESPPEWNGLIWELQIRPGFTACAPPLPTSQCKKLEISNAPLIFFIWGFQAIYWGDRFLKLITTRWGHLRAKEHCNTVTWFWQNRKRKLPGWFQ